MNTSNFKRSSVLRHAGFNKYWQQNL